MIRDHVSDFPVHCARLANSDCLHQRIVSSSDEFLARLGHFSDAVCFVEIAVEPILVNGDIAIHNVSAFERPEVRNAVANDFVD